MGLPLHFFPVYILWELYQLFIKRHHHKDLKGAKLCLGLIQTRLKAFVGFLGKSKIKAYTKLTVVMCCQIVDKKSVGHLAAISGGNRRRGTLADKIRNFDEKSFSKQIITPWPAA